MSLVVDCSVALSWYLPDETSDHARAVLEHVALHGAIVPFHWKAEMLNGLLMALRRGRIESDFVEPSLEGLDRLPIKIDADGLTLAGAGTLQLAQSRQLTIYDALYVETAARHRLALATQDKALRRAASATGVPVFGMPSP